MRISSINSATSFNGIHVHGKHIEKDNFPYEKKPEIPELPKLKSVENCIMSEFLPEIDKTKAEIEGIWTKTGNLMREGLNQSGLSEKLTAFSEFANDENNTLSKFLKRMNIKQNSFVEPKEPFTPWNCLALETQNKEFGKQMLDNIRFSKNMDEIISLSKFDDTKMSASSFRLDYKLTGDIFTTNEEYMQNILKNLKEYRDNYVQTGKKTVMFIDDMDKIGNPEFNSKPNIAWLKDLLQKTHREFGTQGQFIVSDFKKLDPGLTTSNRMAIKENIDKAGFKKEDLETLENFKKDFDPLIEKLKPIYDKGWEKVFPLFKKIQELENTLSDELNYLYKSEWESVETYIKGLRKLGEKYPKVKEMLPVWEDVIKNATGVSLEQTIETAKEGASNLPAGAGGSGLPNPSTPSNGGEIVKTTKTSLGKILIGASAVGIVVFGAYQLYKNNSEKQEKTKNENKIKTDNIASKPKVFSAFG